MGNEKIDAVMFVIEFHKFCLLLAMTQNDTTVVAVQQLDCDFHTKKLN